MNRPWLRYDFLVEKAATLLLLCYPGVMLAVHGGMNGAFLLMLLLALAVLIVRPAGMQPIVWRREWTVYTVAMVAMTLAIFASQSYHHAYRAHPYDAPSRYWLAVPVFLLLLRLRLEVFRALQWGIPIAALLGAALARNIGQDRSSITTLDAIHYGDFELILGMLALFSINWFGRDKPWLLALKLAGLAAGLYASFISGSRGGWLALPVFAALFLHFKLRKLPRKAILIAVLMLVMSAAVAYWASPRVQERIGAVSSDIANFSGGNRDTSTGIRLQLYRVALNLIASHPVFGVGPEGFAGEMQEEVKEGNITPFAAKLGRAEVHSDILAKAAGMGIPGLLAMLAAYLVPLWLFWRASRSAVAELRNAAVLGVVFVSGFIIFGLTVELLDLTMAVAFYSFTVSVLLAASYNVRHTETQHS